VSPAIKAQIRQASRESVYGNVETNRACPRSRGWDRGGSATLAVIDNYEGSDDAIVTSESQFEPMKTWSPGEDRKPGDITA